MASTIQVILTQDLKNLGKSGELVKVRPGFARNYLIPRNLAAPATSRNVAQVEHEQRVSAARAAKERAEAQATAAQLGGVVVTLERKVGEEGRLFGSVTTKDIEAGLLAKGIKVDRKKLVLTDSIRKAGSYQVELRMASEVSATFKVEVIEAKKA